MESRPPVLRPHRFKYGSKAMCLEEACTVDRPGPEHAGTLWQAECHECGGEASCSCILCVGSASSRADSNTFVYKYRLSHTILGECLNSR